MPSDTKREPRNDSYYCHQDLRIPAGEDTIAGVRFEPTEGTAPRPVVLMAFPYHKDDYLTYGRYEPTLRYLTNHGYEVVVMDLPGTGLSTGRKSEPFTEDEGSAVAVVVEWLADQEWSTGAVGMFGKSWGGQTQLRAAQEAPRGLKAIVPVMPAVDLYEDVTYTGGVMEAIKAVGGFPHWFQTLQAMPPTLRDDEGRWNEVWQEHLDELREGTPFLFQMLDHRTNDEYWQSKKIPLDHDVPMLMIAGYRDLHPQPDIDAYHKATGPKHLLLGPWRHTMPHRGREVAINLREQVVEWFDRFLKGHENGADEGPGITYWTERDGGGIINGGHWRQRTQWPSITDPDSDTIDHSDPDSDTTSLSYAFTSAGLTPASEFTDGSVEAEYEYDFTVGTHSQDYLTDRPVNAAPDDTRSLCFETEPLTSPVEFTGTGIAKVRIKATTPDPTVAVRVVDVAPDGESSVVCYGYRNASHRNGHSDPEPLSKDEEYQLSIPLRPKSHVFEEGHQIRVAVSAALFPMTFPPRKHGSFTVLSSPSRPTGVQFPGTVHDDGVSLDDTIEVPGPDQSVELTSPWERTAEGTWTVSRTRPDDVVQFSTYDRKVTDLPHGPALTWEQNTTVETAARDSSMSKVTSTVEATVEFPNETIQANTRGRFTHDTAQLATRIVTDDDHVIFDEEWSR